MDKKLIRTFLTTRFISEESTPGIDVTKKIHKDSGKINKDAVKNLGNDAVNYNKDLKADKNAKEMAQNKFNYNGDKEKEYHEDMEILNGQEMIQYDREPNDEFKARAKEAIEGSTRMGNAGGKGVGNAEETWGASSDDFGKNLIKRAASSSKKRLDAEKGIMSFGDDIETIPKGTKPMAKFSAFNENNNNNKPQIKESMKRIKFNKPFNGVGNALKMIPESYRTDEKEFEMTDGNETYRMRWEGTLNEGRAVVLTAANKSMINEDMQKMKHLMGYKSQETLGLVKGNARLNENAIFGDIYNKTKALLEGEDIESQDAPEKDADDAVNYAKEAKKHVEGTTSDDKGTQAPKPKNGSMENLDDATGHAKEAKKHVEGSVSGAKIGMGLGEKAPEGEWDQIDVPQAAAHGNPSKTTYAPKPATGEWDKINVPQASDAKKHVTMKEGIQLGENYFEEMKDPYCENEEFVDYTMGREDDPNQLPNPARELNIPNEKYGMEENEIGMLRKRIEELESQMQGGLEEYGDEHAVSREDAMSRIRR